MLFHVFEKYQHYLAVDLQVFWGSVYTLEIKEISSPRLIVKGHLKTLSMGRTMVQDE